MSRLIAFVRDFVKENPDATPQEIEAALTGKFGSSAIWLLLIELLIQFLPDLLDLLRKDKEEAVKGGAIAAADFEQWINFILKTLMQILPELMDLLDDNDDVPE